MEGSSHLMTITQVLVKTDISVLDYFIASHDTFEMCTDLKVIDCEQFINDKKLLNLDNSKIMVPDHAIFSLDVHMGTESHLLLGRLGGTALSVMVVVRDLMYEEMVEALASHFDLCHFENSTAQLSARTQKRRESLTEFGYHQKAC